MAGDQRIRGKINIVLNRLVREGVISGFRTDFDDPGRTSGPGVTVIIPASRSLEDTRVLVIDALTEVAIGIKVTAEQG